MSSRKTYEVDSGSKSQWVYLDEPTNGSKVGLSLSGGGIRSAAYSLGVIQRLIDDEIFENIDHLAAVSGGTYIAGGMSITNAKSENGTHEDIPWKNGSIEEHKLRLSTAFIASGLKETVWLISNFLYGLLMNFVPLGLSAFIIGRILGLISLSLLFDRVNDSLVFKNLNTLLVIGTCFLTLGVLTVGCRRLTDRLGQYPSESVYKFFSVTNAVFWTLTGTMLIVLVIPTCINFINPYIDSSSKLIENIGDEVPAFHFSGFVAVAIMIAIVLIGIVLIMIAKRFPRLRFLSVIAIPAGPAVLMVPMLFAIHTSVFDQPSIKEQLPELLLASLVVIIFAVFVHNTRYSLHLFYRERIQRAFGLIRKRDVNGSIQSFSIPYQEVLPLSAFNSNTFKDFGVKLPNIIYCAAVAADRTLAPYRRNAGTYTFESDWSGGPLVGYKKTKNLEMSHMVSRTELTLPAIMAISGAAVSPLMGRFGEPALRFLLAMLNLRLGVWLHHPADSSEIETERKENSLWNVVKRGWAEPGALYVLFEALGIAKSGGKYVYVSDGGHWENLGLVELLRRRCLHIIISDATAPNGNLDDDLARAASLAYSELGVEIEFDFEYLAIADNADMPQKPYAKGVIKYPDEYEGTIFFLRSTLWNDAPFDLHAFQRYDSSFPHHPTTNQFLSGEQFDAYKKLGWSSAGYVKDEFHIPPKSESNDEMPWMP